MSRYETVVKHTLFMGDVYAVNAGELGSQKMDTVLLKKILGQLEAMLSHHNKIIVVRFDLHLSHYTADNRQLNRFFDKARSYAIRHYGVNRMGYVWVRELEKTKRQHYHCAIMLDGNKTKGAHKLIEYMRKRWLFETDSSFHIPDNPTYHLTRDNDNQQTGEVIYRLSYLAKARGKGYKGKNARDFSTSKLKINTEQIQ